MATSKKRPEVEEVEEVRNEGSESIVSFSEDVSDAERPEPLPAGRYTAEIRGAEMKLSRNNTRYAAITFFVPPEEYPANYDADEAPDGTTLVYRRLSLEDSKRARYNIRLFCEAIGAPTARDIDLTDWISRTAVIEVARGEYEGMPTAEIVRVHGE